MSQGGRATARTTAVATSTDGRAFAFVDGAPLPPGTVVNLQPVGRDQALVGQVTHPGGGAVVAGAGGRGRAERRPFSRAAVTAAGPAILEALQDEQGPGLTIGTWTSGETSVPARLAVRGFSRHTFLCGQSGSGKSYALGVLLEQLLLHTDLRVVVLDPNGDYARLGETLADAPPDEAERLRSRAPVVLGPAGSGADPLRLRFAAMPRHAQAAVLELDPLGDRDEYSLFLHEVAGHESAEIAAFVRRLEHGSDREHALGQRLENLGLTRWQVWAGQQVAATEVVARDHHATVLLLSGFDDPREPLAACLALIEGLWASREDREPTLVVVDEAHQICPADPQGAAATALVDRFVQVAAEGRKYGLWLLLSTQRPSKLQPQVLSQCDNLLLMRMNSPSDIAELASTFGFAPAAMIEAAPLFDQGEALVAGRFARLPAFVRMGSRLTREGGHDVDVPQRAESGAPTSEERWSG